MPIEKPSVLDLSVERQSKHVFFPWSKQPTAQPFHIIEARGVHLTLFDGSKVLDFNSAVFNANLGHQHTGMQAAMITAAQNACVTHPALIHEEKIKLGENLARITPGKPFEGLVKSFFCLGGAEANENAVKIARLVTGRHKIITRYRSYHGATLAMIGYSGDYRRIPFDGVVNGVIRIPDPYPRGSGQTIDTVRLLEEILEIEGPETIACILLEGVTGANGVFIPPTDYWKRIRKICHTHGIILIADEVLSGFGRTGKWFGIDHFGIEPDIMTMAKGLTAGYAPLGAVVVNEKIAQHFENETLWCGLTNYGHPFSCAIANAAIKIYEQEDLINNAAKRGKELRILLRALKNKNPYVAEIRSLGLLAAIDLQKGPDDERPYVAYRAQGKETQKIQALQSALLKGGVYCTVRFGTLILAPPLCIGSAELKQGVDIIASVLQETLGK
jgi:taurine---2-oxoglutarate transaminase